MNVIFELFGHAALADSIAAEAHADRGHLLVRRFPDGECYLRFESEVANRDVAFVANLARPDDHIPALLFAASTAKELGARNVGLVSPYLPYMRQDRRFQSGEAVTSRAFAHLISTHFDWVVTVDPHLHRYASLSELYTIPAVSLSAAPLIAEWISAHVEQPLLLGPDAESAQWVSAVAEHIGAPWAVSQKTRHGDRNVDVELPDIALWQGRNAVLLDDIIASGNTMLKALAQMRDAGYNDPVCVGIHAIFCDDSYPTLIGAGAQRILTTDSVPHESNAIRLAALLANAVTAVSSRLSSCPD
jgi:ribose-phosphate pyrophosphokinase